MLIKPFTAAVNAQGNAIINIGHSLSKKVWKIYQVGFALGQVSNFAQVAAHVNGVPLAATITMQKSVFANLPGQAPYAMESFMVGPPYIFLNSGDLMVCGIIGATSGDMFTAAAYIDELDDFDEQSMGF
jgi:hypothetical protein